MTGCLTLLPPRLSPSCHQDFPISWAAPWDCEPKQTLPSLSRFRHVFLSQRWEKWQVKWLAGLPLQSSQASGHKRTHLWMRSEGWQSRWPWENKSPSKQGKHQSVRKRRGRDSSVPGLPGNRGFWGEKEVGRWRRESRMGEESRSAQSCSFVLPVTNTRG